MGFFAVALAVVFFLVHLRLRNRVNELERHIEQDDSDDISKRLLQLEHGLSSMEGRLRDALHTASAAPTPPPAATVAPPAAIVPAAPIPARAPDPIGSLPPAPSRDTPWRDPLAPVAEFDEQPSQASRRWKRLERQLVENWTGILGSAVLVAGITFIGGYTGLFLSPFYRTLMVVGAAAVLFSGSLILQRHAKWKPLAQWLRSSGAAVFLFACFASSAIPGLQWVTGLGPSLAILLLGVAANLVVGFVANSQAVGSLHVVLSLVPLTLVPQSELSLALATLVTVAGLVPAFRRPWHLQTLITVAAFCVFHAAWYPRAFAPSPGMDGRVIGALSALLVGVLVALTHYRRGDAAVPFKAFPFIVHLAGWSVVATGLAVYIGGTPLRGAALIAAAIAVFFLARRARAMGSRWLYLTDTLAAQAIALVGVVSFYPFVSHGLIVPAMVLLQTFLYLKIATDEREPVLERVGIRVMHAATAVLVVAGLWALHATPAERHESAIILFASVLCGTAMHLYLVRRRGEAFDSESAYVSADTVDRGTTSLLGVGVGVLAALGVVHLVDSPWMAVAGFAASTLFVLLARGWGSSGLEVAAWTSLVATHVLSWSLIATELIHLPSQQLLRHLGPLMLADCGAIAFAAPGRLGRFLRHSAIYAAGLTVALAAYTLLQPLSSLAPAVAWLTLSLVALECANRVRRDYCAAVLHLGYLYLACFAGSYFLVVLQAQVYLGPLPARALIEALALGVGAYWWLYRPRPEVAMARSWRFVHPMFLELALAFLVVVVAVEAATQWRPLVWGVLALMLLSRPLGGTLDPRLRFYSMLLFWACVGDLSVVTSVLATPSGLWYQRPGFTGGLTMAVQVAYLALGSPRLRLLEVEFPPGLGLLARWSRSAGRRQPLWLYYPFFVGGALFLYWRFGATLRTLLWSGEAFVVFLLSLVLRESQFRYMALAGLAVCVIRLLVFDMAQANLGLRGLVFVGVGLLMLGMNSLYNKYKERAA